MPMPVELIAPAKRANDLLAASLKLTWAEGLFHRGFNTALNCCEGLVHNDVDVAARELSGGGELALGVRKHELCGLATVRAGLG